MEIEKLLKQKIVILDGAMGTMLQNSGLLPGEYPEAFCMTHEDVIYGIHKQYVDSGCDIIYTNTFGANQKKLLGSGYSSAQIIDKAVRIAKNAALNSSAKVALSIGPIGELLQPMGTLSFEEAYDLFAEMLIAGEAAGADLVVFETMADLFEMKTAVLAAKENMKLPIFASMTFEKTGRTFLGCSIESMACVLQGLGVDAIGLNCSLGPGEIFPFAEKLLRNTNLPILVKANAGLPDPITGQYDVTPEAFAEEMKKYAAIGIHMMGGCCGTTPEYIKQIVRDVRDVSERAPYEPVSAVCTPSRYVKIDGGIRVIGENINPTGKKQIQAALTEQNMNFLMSKAVLQAEAGADILDINVGMPGIDETRMMEMTVKAVQSVTDLPLQIDSSNPQAIEAALRAINGKAIVNSVHATKESMDAIFPLVKKYGASVIGLTIDEGGIPQNAEKRLEIAERILAEALRYGIQKEDVFVDCLTLTVSAQQSQVKETLKAVKMVREKLGLHAVLGVSNISFGIPGRELVTRTFLVQAMAHGLDLPIINPTASENMEAIAAFRVLSEEDKDCTSYIEMFSRADGAASVKTDKTETIAETNSLEEAIIKGLKAEAANLTQNLLREEDAMSIINRRIIPALDQVGELFEKQKIFLPQLIHSANASCEAFGVIKAHELEKGAPAITKGKIVLATVKGDVHDIGKNIVRIVLENYGYKVYDLGKDVPASLIVETAIREDAKLVGLSALMTTTLPSMEETIQALRASGHECKIVVGGAVLTPEYAASIGADEYAEDAKKSADIAKRILG